MGVGIDRYVKKMCEDREKGARNEDTRLLVMYGWNIRLTSRLAVEYTRKGVVSLKFKLLCKKHSFNTVHPGALGLVAGSVSVRLRPSLTSSETLLGDRIELIRQLRADASAGRVHVHVQVQVRRVLQPTGAQAVVVVHVHQHSRLEGPLGQDGHRWRAVDAVVVVETTDR